MAFGNRTGRDRRRSLRRRRPLACRRPLSGGTLLALLAVLALMLLPAFQAVAMARHGGAAAPPDSLSIAAAEQITMVICTPYGYKLVSLADVLKSDAEGKGGKSPGADRACALCPALAQQDLAMAPGLFILGPVPVAVAAGPWVVVAGHIMPAGPPPLKQPRAPPVFQA